MNAHAVFAIAAASVALALALQSKSRTDVPQDVKGPVLIVRRDAGPTLPRSNDDEDRAMALAVASIDPAERTRILDQMRYTTARLETRLSPLGTDFGDDDGDPVEAFRSAMAAHMASFTAARAFERGAWSAAGVSARVARSCADAEIAPGETCVPLWGDEGASPLHVRRARFLAWAASQAAIVDLGTPAAADACARALRIRLADPSSTVALVLTEADLALRPLPEQEELREAARRLGIAMAANHIEDHQHLDAFARAAPKGRVAPWLDLTPTSVLVVPRLSALARTQEFAAAIEAAAGEVRIAWVRRP
jgi:hypothetical protein